MSDHTPSRASGVRRGPRKQDHFTILDNAALNDERLSFRARGVLAYILSKPADWRTTSASLARVAKEGRDAIRAAINELKDAGYIVYEKIRDAATGRISTICTVYEVPVEGANDPDVVRIAAPGPGKPAPGEPNLGNPGRNQRTGSSQRTETNHHQTSTPEPADNTAPAEVSVVGGISDDRLRPLAAACQAKGLPAVWGTLSRAKADAIVDLVDAHGIDALVAHAVTMHNPANVTRHAGGLLLTWQSIPAPQPKAHAAPACDSCDNGWLLDDDRSPTVPCPTCRPNHFSRRTPKAA
ncbi:replication protein [Rhodococcus sp. T2V]|uniref:replication protein n=1 Tax=Rhodococcus sp. T2V TaxID=3034164 RepID=UPI0023E30F97|nr:replication protein [Rhodococcus sp. T2V]MDF3309728.1 replication protein [Rhodococcus sp. T2V]